VKAWPFSDFHSRACWRQAGNFSLGNVTVVAGLGDDTHFLQISAPVQPGNSGGPLLDYSGNVVVVVEGNLNAIKVAAAVQAKRAATAVARQQTSVPKTSSNSALLPVPSSSVRSAAKLSLLLSGNKPNCFSDVTLFVKDQ
jgi:hypothetical protein